MENGPALVDPGPDADPGPELLQLGPRPANRHTVPILIGLVALIVAGLLAWQLWPRPVPPLTLAELEGIYAGMVRGDGSNDASLLPRPNQNSTTVTPAQCQPMLDPVELDRFPHDAVDAMGTYWTGNLDSGSLFSFRFTDAATAQRAYGEVAAALEACDGKQASWGRALDQSVQIRRTEVSTDDGVTDQLGFLYVKGGHNRFAVHVLRQLNLVTWQFRYAGTGDDYSPFSAQQRMDSLVAQTSAVIDLRRSAAR